MQYRSCKQGTIYNRSCNTDHADKAQSTTVRAIQIMQTRHNHSGRHRHMYIVVTLQETMIFIRHAESLILFSTPYSNGNTNRQKLRHKRINYSIQSTEKIHLSVQNSSAPPPLSSDPQYNHVMDCIRDLEL